VKKAEKKLNNDQKQALSHLYKSWYGEDVRAFKAFPPSGSNRRYYRMISDQASAIGVVNPDYKENEAFIHMTRFFRNERINVPALLGEDLHHDVYLTEDLGDTTLFKLITQNSDDPVGDPEVREKIRQAIRELARIQVVAGKKMDFSVCYPHSRFHKDSMRFDLNYFREQFLDQIGMDYHREQLEEDFQRLAEIILEADQDHFMYRDFQSRNVMVYQNDVYFIDYQGGRKGPLQYDLAAFLYQARARFPESFRKQMIDYYLKVARLLTPIDEDAFRKYFYPVALLRVLQTLGAYGLRGLKERKQHFIESIPFALENLGSLYRVTPELSDLPELKKIIRQLMYTKIHDHGSNQ